MKQHTEEKEPKEKAVSGEVSRRDVKQRLLELAYGRANDCVRLVLEEHPCPEGLDLSLLSEIRRSDKGLVEVKLIDRLRVLEQLAAMTEEPRDEAAAFLQALQEP